MWHVWVLIRDTDLDAWVTDFDGTEITYTQDRDFAHVFTSGDLANLLTALEGVVIGVTIYPVV
jgi:hypothetical protein